MVSGIAYGIGRYFIYDKVPTTEQVGSASPFGIYHQRKKQGTQQSRAPSALITVTNLLLLQSGKQYFFTQSLSFYICLAQQSFICLTESLVYILRTRFSFSFPLPKLSFPFFTDLFICLFLFSCLRLKFINIASAISSSL